MKQILVSVLVFIILFSLAGCGYNSDSKESNSSTPSDKNSNVGNKISKSSAAKETSSTGEGDSVENARIKFKFGNEEVIAKMYDNPTSRALLGQLPLTITFEDYAGSEKISYPPKTLTTEGAPSGADPKLGDLALYSPWGNLAVYYGESKYADGLIILGHIESGEGKFSEMGEKTTVTIERMD